ncbi:type I secretion system permease/ATPase [Pseudohoeflea suaedae]|uniref:Type I secretion system permease/ATPase n=1 Tax=Pseudohoeflea suaedae TaxID=877384 RepID=A0A4R5PI10_9HYPH|nr:type I secretion system permease/ATPase [Pseudohoeflea suaedae]TDH34483.1 type I secretion system permease/ATPase [Pseudohoeflea suaedae]
MDRNAAAELTGALVAVAEYFDRPSSRTVLFSGVPDTFDNVENHIRLIVDRIGLFCRSTQGSRAITETDVEYPAVLQFGNPARSFEFALDAEAFRAAIVRNGRVERAYQFGLLHSSSQERDLADGTANVSREHWLFGPMRQFGRGYSGIVVAALFINLLALASPIFVMNVYDRILPNKATSSLLALALGVGLAMIFDYFLKTIRADIIDATGRRIDEQVSSRLFDKILNSRLDAQPPSTGEYANRVNQLDFVREFFTSNTVAVLIDTVFIFIFLVVIHLIGGWLFVIPLIAFILAVVIGLVAQYRIAKRVTQAANESSRRQALLIETISTIETVKSLRSEAKLLKNWSLLTKASSRTSEEIKLLSAHASNATGLVQQLVTIFIVIAGAYEFSLGNISTGAIIATVMLSGRTIAPISQITLTLARLRQALLSLKILDGIMAQPEDRPASAGFVNRQVMQGSLSFAGVSFSYPGSDAKVLNDVTFSIRQGERVGVIGRIGSGKTTLGRLLANLYTAQEGRVCVDGIDVRQYHPAELRGAVAYTGQTVDLFTGTLRENLRMANPAATDEEIIASARKTGVDEFVSIHPRGYDLLVGERGANLSGGQRQAVAMTRLLLAQPKIVFLDEPSGALDLATERQLIGTLSDSFGPDVTMVISTHRYSLLELVDRLIVLDRGRIVADGPRDKVLEHLSARVRAVQGNLAGVRT